MKSVTGSFGSGSARTRLSSAPRVIIMGTHSFPEVCWRPTRTSSRVVGGSASARSPSARSAAAATTAFSLMRGSSTRASRRRVSAQSIPGPSSRAKSAAAPRCEAPSRRSPSTQYRNASRRVFVPASPECPSVSMTALGFPCMA